MALSDTAAAFKRLAREVSDSKSETAAVNAVIRTLVAGGTSRAGAQGVQSYETKYDGHVLRVYVWHENPFGDALVLAAGPAFASKVSLASMIEPSNAVGLFIHGVLRSTRPSALGRLDMSYDRLTKRAAAAAAPPRTRRSIVVEEAPPASVSATAAVKAAEVATKTLEKVEAAASKPRRGRPPGSKNKAKVEEHAIKAVEAAQDAVDAEAEAKAAEARAEAARRDAEAAAAAIEREARASKEKAAATAAEDAKTMMAGFLNFLEGM